jgi:hypothetical protein
VPPALDPRFLDRVRQVQWDHYYIEIARTVATRANCTGSRVGAVLVAENRIIATGFNGTPAGFPNCLDGGCLRCRDRALYKAGRKKEMADKSLAKGPKQLDTRSDAEPGSRHPSNGRDLRPGPRVVVGVASRSDASRSASRSRRAAT